MKLYSEHNINPMAGCLPLLIQFPILYGILDVVYRPLTHILRFSKETLSQAQELLTVYLNDAGIVEKKYEFPSGAYNNEVCKRKSTHI